MNYSNLYTVKVVEKFNEKNNIELQINNLSLNENKNVIINNTQIELEDNIVFKNKNDDIMNDINDVNDVNNENNEDNNVEMVSESENENYYHYVTLCIMSDINGFNIKEDLNTNYFSINMCQYSLIIQSDETLPTFAIVEVDENFKYKTYIKSLLLDNFGIKNKDIIKIKHMNTNKNFHNYFIKINDNTNLPCSMQVAPAKKLFCKRTFFGMYSDGDLYIKNNKIIINKKEYPYDTSDQKIACILLIDNILPSLNISFKGTLVLQDIDNTISLIDIIKTYSEIV